MNFDEQYVVSDTEIEMAILDTPLPLFKDLVRDQVREMRTVNYFEIIVDKLNYMKSLYGDDPDTMSKINMLTTEIATFFIDEICNKFDLSHSFDRHPGDLMEIAEAMYNSMILNYQKNIRKYLKSYITENRKEIADQYSNKKKDVTTASVKKKVRNREMISIVSNLPIVVRDLIAVAPTIEGYFETFNDYENGLVFEAFNTLELAGSMDKFFGVLTDEHEFMLDVITDSLKEKLTK